MQRLSRYGKIYRMRMRRKHHLESRMENCSDCLFVADGSDKNMKRAVEQKEYIDFSAYFKNDNPVEMEIGCGFGSFICRKAEINPGVNYIAVEKVSNVIVSAAESVRGKGIKNVFLLNCSAEILTKYIKPNSVSKIYLNFSTPLPKSGYAKQRLTHPRFLEIYKELLIDGGEIVQKTDDEGFFEFSLESFESCGFTVLEKCTDLAALGDRTNIVTEYESKFMQSGKKIFRIVAKK